MDKINHEVIFLSKNLPPPFTYSPSSLKAPTIVYGAYVLCCGVNGASAT